MKNFKVLLLLVLVVLLSACSSNKEAIDDEKFKNIMEKDGFSITSAKDQFSEYDYIEDVYLAIDKNSTYQIEFYELEDDEYAISFYNVNKEIFQASETDKSVYTNVDLTESNKYTLTTEDDYKVLSRIEDTVIYVDVDKEYKEEVQSVLKKLGY